jgi:hypothetical protein
MPRVSLATCAALASALTARARALAISFGSSCKQDGRNSMDEDRPGQLGLLRRLIQREMPCRYLIATSRQSCRCSCTPWYAP